MNYQLLANLENWLGQQIVGQQDLIHKLMLALLANGHLLVEGAPGLAKTRAIKEMAEGIEGSFHRIQFTPDVMPADITGTDIIKEEKATGSRELVFEKGPIFSQIILADEINRTPPKTQAALLEAMQEHCVTIGGTTYNLDEPFFVLATQNPIEQEGTYPLPEAQLDRFMFIIRMDYPQREQEISIARQTTSGSLPKLKTIMTGSKLKRYQDLVEKIPVPDHVYELAVDLVRRTRPGSSEAPSWIKQSIQWGAGPRASSFLILAAKAQALLLSKATPDIDDVKKVAIPVLRHRICLLYTSPSPRDS